MPLHQSSYSPPISDKYIWNVWMNGYLGKKPGAYSNFSLRNRGKMCTRGKELANIHLPYAFNG